MYERTGSRMTLGAAMLAVAVLIATDVRTVRAQATARPQTASSLAGPVWFPHERHYIELGIACRRCHHDVRAAALKMPHASYFDDFWIDCRICHKTTKVPSNMPQPCVTCHRVSPRNLADETLSAKVVIHKQCWGCHEAKTGAAASRGCATCHRRLTATGGAVQPPPAASAYRRPRT